MENYNNDSFDLNSLWRYLVRNWYWFLISFVLVACLGICYRATLPKKYIVEMAVQFQTPGESVLVPGTRVLQTANNVIEVGDEKSHIISRDVIEQAVKELKLNAVYKKKQHLRWVEQGCSWSDLTVTYPDKFISNLYEPLKVKVHVGEKGVTVKIKKRYKSESYKVNSLAEPWTSPEGITLGARKELKVGSSYLVTILPTFDVVSSYYTSIKTNYPHRSKTVFEVTLNTTNCYQMMELMNKELEVYNRIALANRQADAEQALVAIDERLAELGNQKPKAQNKEMIDQLTLLMLQRREDKAIIARNTQEPASFVAKPRITSETISLSWSKLVFLVLSLGLGIPAGVFLFIFITSGKIYNHYQFAKRVQVPFIGQISYSGSHQHIVVSDGVFTPASEQLRVLRMNVLQHFETAKDKVVMVTSCGQGDGKSFVASNLAMSLSLLNKRVLLVDLNLRHPSVHECFGKPNNQGVTDYLADTSFAIESLVLSCTKTLDILPTGMQLVRIGELLLSERLEQLFAILRKQYDFIVVDAARARNLSDAFVANRVCDETLFVAYAEQTTEEDVDFINQTAAQHRMTNIVAVFNGIQ